MPSLYQALGSVDNQLSQIKLAIAQEEDEVESLRDTLAQVKLQNTTFTQDIMKIQLEVQIGESKAAGAKVTKSSLQNEVEELKLSLSELRDREGHVKRQLDRLNNYRIQKRKDYQELHAQFKERYLQIPTIAEYESINSVFSRTRDALEEKRASSTKLKEELMALHNSNAKNWNSFKEICIRSAMTHVKAQKVDLFIKSSLKERDELERRFNNRNMSLDERLTQFRKIYNLEQGSVVPTIAIGSKIGMMSAPRSAFHVPNSRLFKNPINAPGLGQNKLSLFGSFMSKNKTTILPDIMVRSTEVTHVQSKAKVGGMESIKPMAAGHAENMEQGNKEDLSHDSSPVTKSCDLTLEGKVNDTSLIPGNKEDLCRLSSAKQVSDLMLDVGSRADDTSLMPPPPPPVPVSKTPPSAVPTSKSPPIPVPVSNSPPPLVATSKSSPILVPASKCPPPPEPTSKSLPHAAPVSKSVSNIDAEATLSNKRKEMDCDNKTKHPRTDEDVPFCASSLNRSTSSIGGDSANQDIFGGNTMGLNLFGESSNRSTELTGTESVFDFFQSSGGSLF